MSTTSAKRKVAKKKPVNGGASEGPAGGSGPSRLSRERRRYIARDISLHVVMKNLGPGMVGIPIGPRGDLEKLTAGTLVVRVIVGALTIENLENKPALVEMEFSLGLDDNAKGAALFEPPRFRSAGFQAAAAGLWVQFHGSTSPVASQARQANFSRTCWITFHWGGTSSGVSSSAARCRRDIDEGCAGGAPRRADLGT